MNNATRAGKAAGVVQQAGVLALRGLIIAALGMALLGMRVILPLRRADIKGRARRAWHTITG